MAKELNEVVARFRCRSPGFKISLASIPEISTHEATTSSVASAAFALEEPNWMKSQGNTKTIGCSACGVILLTLAACSRSPGSGTQISSSNSQAYPPGIERLVRVEDRFGLPLRGVRVGFAPESPTAPLVGYGEYSEAEARYAIDAVKEWKVTDPRGTARLDLPLQWSCVIALHEGRAAITSAFTSTGGRPWDLSVSFAPNWFDSSRSPNSHRPFTFSREPAKSPQPVLSRGRVRDAHGRPLAGVRIRANDSPFMSPLATTWSRSDGSYELRAAIPDQSPTIQFSHEGYAPQDVLIPKGKRDEAERTVTLHRLGQLKGRILLPVGVEEHVVMIRWIPAPQPQPLNICASSSYMNRIPDPGTRDFEIPTVHGKGRFALFFRPFTARGRFHFPSTKPLWEKGEVIVHPGRTLNLGEIDLRHALHIRDLILEGPPTAKTLQATIEPLNALFRRISPGSSAPIRLVSRAKALKVRISIPGWQPVEAVLEDRVTTLRLKR